MASSSPARVGFLLARSAGARWLQNVNEHCCRRQLAVRRCLRRVSTNGHRTPHQLARASCTRSIYHLSSAHSSPPARPARIILRGSFCASNNNIMSARCFSSCRRGARAGCAPVTPTAHFQLHEGEAICAHVYVGAVWLALIRHLRLLAATTSCRHVIADLYIRRTGVGSRHRDISSSLLEA